MLHASTITLGKFHRVWGQALQPFEPRVGKLRRVKLSSRERFLQLALLFVRFRELREIVAIFL